MALYVDPNHGGQCIVKGVGDYTNPSAIGLPNDAIRALHQDRLGRLWIGLMPNEHSNLIGLSKYARLAEWVMSRPQIQEEAVVMLADALQERVKPDGMAIVMEADHFCMHWRGVKDDESAMTNSVMRGAFLKDANLRREFLSLLSKKNGN